MVGCRLKTAVGREFVLEGLEVGSGSPIVGLMVKDALSYCDALAVLAASIFHFGEIEKEMKICCI